MTLIFKYGKVFMVKYMEFREKLEKYVENFNNNLEKYRLNKECLEGRLFESMEYSLFSCGKRIRPILMMSACEMLGYDFNICIPYAVSLEMIHNFSLIHDDLPGIDNDDFRHFKPTNHKVYGEATAILAGDNLLNMAYKIVTDSILSDSNNDNVIRKVDALNYLSNAVNKMIVGEYLDTINEGKKINVDELNYIHNNKTGALIEAALVCAGILCNANKDDINNLKNYAKDIGLAFQIKDDILSELGDRKITGKPVGNDKDRKKCTYVAMYGVKKSLEILDDLITDSKNSLKVYGSNAKFLKDMADYIKDREK